MLAYVVVLVVSVLLLGANTGAPWRVLVAVAPVVPAMSGPVAFLRFPGRMGELQRQIHLEATAFAGGARGILTFAYGFLESARFRHLSPVFVLSMLVGLWGIGVAIAGRRYT